MGQHKRSQSSKGTPASLGLFDYLRASAVSPAASKSSASERTRASNNLDQNSASYNLLGKTTRSDTTTITNNYIKDERGISMKDTAGLVGLGAALVVGGCLIGSHLFSGSSSNNTREEMDDDESHEQDQQPPTRGQRNPSQEAQDETMEGAVVVETPHTRIRAAAGRQQSARRAKTSRHSANTDSTANSAKGRELRAKALDILKS